MSIVNRAIEQSVSIWDECMNTSFVKELCEGVLDEAKLKKYIIFDTIYLKEYARCFAYLITKAKTIEEMKILYSFLNFINEGEASIRLKYLRRYDLNDDSINDIKIDGKVSEYIDHLIHYSKNGTLQEAVMALLPCMLSYEYIFSKLNIKYNFKENKYYDLLSGYISNDCKIKCDNWKKFAEQICDNDEKLIEIFRQSSQYELCFWIECYN